MFSFMRSGYEELQNTESIVIPVKDKIRKTFGRSIIAPVIKSFVTNDPTYWEYCGMAGLKCWYITFGLSPQCTGNNGVLTLIRILTHGRFSTVKDRTKSKVLTKFDPGRGAYSRTRKGEIS